MVRSRNDKKRSGGRKKALNGDGQQDPGVDTRPTWQGHLRLSLVSCPVALYSATTRKHDISFHLLNPETHNRIRMIPTDPETGPISRSELVKGYEIEKNRYVILEPEELEAVRLETTRALDIERFVDLNSIDRLYWNDPFFLLPEGPEGVDAYIVIREAMRATRRIALGRVVMHTRERLMALEPRDKGIVAYSLRMGDEVLSVEKAFRDIPNARPQRQMIEVAEKIIEQQEGPFEPSKFTDRYESALRDLIRRKERGEKTVAVLPPEPSNVIDLMDALRKSLARKGASTNKQSRARMRQLAARQHKLRSRS